MPKGPLPVTFVADDAAAVTAEIDEAGGLLTTADADGVVYRLLIPPTALLGPESITMTPIDVDESAIETLAISAVSLEPSGLVFFKTPILEIEKPAAVAASTAAFGSQENGAEFHLTPASIGDTTLIPVPHFSEVGVIEGRAEVDRIRAEYSGGSRQVGYLQGLATILDRVRDPAAAKDAVSSVFSDWFSDIADAAGFAEGADAVNSVYGELLVALANVTSVETLLDVTLGDIGPAIAEAAQAVQEATNRRFREANLRCIQDQNPDQVFEMLRWGTLHQFLWDESYGPLDRSDEFMQAINACMRFEVHFTSSADIREGGGGFATQVEILLPLEFGDFGPSLFFSRGDFRSPEAEGPLTGVSDLKSEGGSARCAPSGTFAVVLDLGLAYSGGGTLSETSIEERTLLVRFPKIATWTCAAAQGSINLQESLWHPWFIGLELERLSFDDVFEFPLEPGSGEIYGRYENAGASEGVAITVDIELRHSPQLP